MATPFPQPITAAQIGTCFVGQYYELLEQQPEFVYNFYSDVSTMVRIDGNTRESATGMLQIHSLIMSLNFAGVEIMTAHSLESWSGGVLVMVTGSVQLQNMGVPRKFMQTLFLAPQENGFFVLNDIFHLNFEEPVHPPRPAVFLPQSNLESKPNEATIILEPVKNYLGSGEIETRDFAAQANVKENGNADKYSFQEQLLPCIPQTENILEEDYVQESNAVSVNTVQQPPPARVDEPVKTPQKHTYASILRVNNGQSSPSTATQPSVNQKTSSDPNQKTTPAPNQNTIPASVQKKAPASIQKMTPASNQKTTPASNQKTAPASEQHYTSQGPQSNGQHSLSTVETPWEDIPEEVSTMGDEGEIKSVYVKNLLPNISPSEIEEQFKRFGKIKPDGVVIRSRKDLGVCYAFVEFEDINGVQNAVKVSSVEIGGRPVYIEERRANSNNSSRGGRRGRGRGRGSYITSAPRGRFVTRYGRGTGQDGSDRDYRPRTTNGFYRQVHGQDGSDHRDYKPRATNGFYRQVPRQDGVVTGNHASGNEQDQAESTA